MSFRTIVNRETWRENYQEWHNTTSKDKVGRIVLRMQDEEYLNSLKQNTCRAPCLILSIVWRIITSREILKNNWRMKSILDEPPWRNTRRTPVIKEWSKRRRSWKHKVKPFNYLYGATKWYNWKSLELWERKDEASQTEKCDMMNNSRKKKLDHLDETIIRIMLCVSFTNLNWWQATDLAYYLFS